MVKPARFNKLLTMGVMLALVFGPSANADENEMAQAKEFSSELSATLSKGSEFEAQSKYLEAIAAYKSGLHVIGNNYSCFGANDDTGMILVNAEHEARNGRYSTSATYFRAALESRIALRLRCLARNKKK